PAAIAVGLGRAARNGILFRNASVLESFKNIKQIVFDKTGTLTTGAFIVRDYNTTMDDAEFKRILFSLEKFSNHPIGKSISKQWQTTNPINWKNIEEKKGSGMYAEDVNGNVYQAVSDKNLPSDYPHKGHNIYLMINDEIKGWVDIEDEIRPEAAEMISRLHKKGIKTIMLSGDKQEKTNKVGLTLGIDEIIAEQTPQQKLEKIKALNT